MRSILLLLLLLSPSMLVAQPAVYQWYIGASHGLPQVKDIHYTIDGVKKAATNDLHTGQRDLDLMVGRRFGKLRTEIEAGYKSTRIHHYFAYIPVPVEHGVVPPGTYNDATGHIRVASLMLNASYDLFSLGRFTSYAGLGAGIARIRYDHFRIAGPAPFLNSSDVRPAWQALAGTRYSISNRFDLGVKYRYFRADDVAIRGRFADDLYESNFRSHSLLGTLSYNFGGSSAQPRSE